MLRKLFTSAFILALLSLICQGSSDYSAEYTLVKELLKNYDPDIRPIRDASKPVIVTLTFMLKKVENLDEKNQILSSYGWVKMDWKDEFLAWNPANYNNTYRLVVPAYRIWLPELAMYNSVDQENDLNFDPKFRLSILYDGKITFSPSYKWKTECRVNLEYFPFDNQTCTVIFINWVYLSGGLQYSVTGVDLSIYTENNAWELSNVTARDELGHYATVEGQKYDVPRAYFTVYLKRKPMYYVINVLVPSFMISLLSCMVFLLPSDAGEKISLSITVLLAYTIVLLMVSDITPKSGTTTPYITVFIVVSMSQAALSLIITVILLNVYHHGTKPIPACLRRVVFGFLANVVCLGGKERLSAGNDVSPKNSPTKWDSTVQQTNRNEQVDTDNNQTTVKHNILPDDVVKYIRCLMELDKEKGRENIIKSDWVALGVVLDRVMFCCVLMVTVFEIVLYLCLVLVN